MKIIINHDATEIEIRTTDGYVYKFDSSALEDRLRIIGGEGVLSLDRVNAWAAVMQSQVRFDTIRETGFALLACVALHAYKKTLIVAVKAKAEAADDGGGAVWNADYDQITPGREMFYAPEQDRSQGRVVKVLHKPYVFHGKYFVQIFEDCRSKMVRASDLSVE